MKGCNSFNAIDFGKEAVELTAGHIWYISRSWSPEQLSVDLPKIPNSTSAFEGQTFRTSISGFDVRPDELLKSWNFNLHSTTGIQKITNVDETETQVNVEWDETIVTTFTLSAPVGTEEGIYSASIVLIKEKLIQRIPIKATIVVDNKKDNCYNSQPN